jgi:Protein of unknown function (DUF3304)
LKSTGDRPERATMLPNKLVRSVLVVPGIGLLIALNSFFLAGLSPLSIASLAVAVLLCAPVATHMRTAPTARLLIGLALSASACGCNPQAPATALSAPSSASRAVAVAEANVQAHNLTIYGYNYTDTGIGSFEVNGQGGGNLEVSIPTAGGGKSTCCLTVYTPMREPRPIKNQVEPRW